MQSDFEFERCGGCGGCGVLKSAREQKGNKRISGVYSRRLGGRANLESDKHAGKPGAFATLDRFAWCRSVARLDVASAVTALARPAGPAAVHLLLELVLDAVVAARREGVQAQVTWPPLAGEERKHRMLVTMLAMFCVFAWFVCGLHRISLGPVCEPVNSGALQNLSLKKVPMVSIRSPQSDFKTYLWGKRA